MPVQKRKNYLLGMAVVVLLPLFTWLLVKHLGEGVIKIPKKFGINYIDTIKAADGTIRYDTFYQIIKEVHLDNQLGRDVRLNQDLRGKILVIGFFNTLSTAKSKLLVGNLQLLERSYKKNPDWVQFLSVSVNPNHDHITQIRAFADKMNVNSDHLWLLTKDSATVFNYIKEELKLPINPSDTTPPNQFVLIDTFRNVRGYYDATDTFQLRDLADDISILTMEKRKD